MKSCSIATAFDFRSVHIWAAIVLLFFVTLSWTAAANAVVPPCNPPIPVRHEAPLLLETSLGTFDWKLFQGKVALGELTKSQKQGHIQHRKEWDAQVRDAIELGELDDEASKTLTLVFQSERFETKFDEVIPLNQGELWCILRAGDLVLLSDGITHHYTLVHDIDRDRSTVQFIDLWPEQFFLKRGLNVRGIAARELESKNGRLIEISKDEFLSVLISFSTQDDGPLIAYLRSFPSIAMNAAANIGIALRYYGNGRAYPFDFNGDHVEAAVDFFRVADALYQKSNQRMPVQIAAKMKVLLTLQVYAHKAGMRKAKAHEEEAAKRDVTRLNELYGEHALNAILTAEDYSRLAIGADSADEPLSAVQFLTKAIELDDHQMEAFYFRSRVKLNLKDYSGAIADANRFAEAAQQQAAVVAADKGTLSFFPSHRRHLRALRSRGVKAIGIKVESWERLGNTHEAAVARAALENAQKVLIDEDTADMSVGDRAYKQGDLVTAFRHWSVFAEKGGSRAQLKLGNLYAAGPAILMKRSSSTAELLSAMMQNRDSAKTFAQDWAQALKWWTLAAEQGEPEAMYDLGAMYARGDGTKIDNATAYMWLSLASEHGYPEANGVLKRLQKEMKISEIEEGDRLLSNIRGRISSGG